MKVSIITPVYNSEKFIEESIKSVLSQTYTNWEMILVDDCSKDSSKSIISKYVEIDERIKYVKLDKNSGAAVARNTAIEMATGRFIAFLDSDDLWHKNKLEKQIEFMLENNIGFSFTSYETINELGENNGKVIRVPETPVNYEFLLKNTIIGCLTVIIDRKIIGDIRMPLLRTRQDFATWLSILKKGHKAYGFDEVLATYRIVSDSISSNKLKVARKNWDLYRNVENLSFFKSLYVFCGYTYNAVRKRI